MQKNELQRAAVIKRKDGSGRSLRCCLTRMQFRKNAAAMTRPGRTRGWRDLYIQRSSDVKKLKRMHAIQQNSYI